MKTMLDRRCLALSVALVAGLVLPACGDSTGSIPDVPRALLVVTVEPNPVIGVQNVVTGSVSAAYVVQLREISGLGGAINFLNSTIFDPETGIQRASNYFDSADLKVFSGTDRLEPGGELDVTQTTDYILPEFRVEADLVVNVQMRDDQGNLLNQSTLVRVIPPE